MTGWRAAAFAVAVWGALGGVAIAAVIASGIITRRRDADRDGTGAVAHILGAHYRDLRKDLHATDHVPDAWVEEFRR